LIRVGDTVFSASGQFGIPVPMVIGRISAIEENPKKRLVYDLLVEPVVSIDRLTEVYVIPAVPVGALTLAP
jgi:cell shape-determining protein MreC